MNRSVNSILAAIPSVRASLYATGIALPHQYQVEIERIRQRGPGEQDYQAYLNEVLREAVALPYPWQPSIRHLLKPQERSAYLDEQARHVPKDAFSLDRNFNSFVGCFRHLADDFRQQLAVQKQREVELHAAEVARRHGRPAASALRSLAQIADSFGFVKQGKESGGTLAFSMRGAQMDGISIRLVDTLSLKKRGSVLVQYCFPELPNRVLGLGHFLPGAVSYFHDNNDQETVHFAFYLQLRFLCELVAAVDIGRMAGQEG